MKRYISLLFPIALACLATQEIQAQSKVQRGTIDHYPPPPSCQQANVVQVELATDATKRKILMDFISKSVRNNYFIQDKGIVELRIYQNQEGLTCWLLLPRIDDRYKDNPPAKFAEFGEDIILVYDADSNGHILKADNPQPLNKCFEEIVGDRVYIRPVKKERWVSKGHTLADGRKVRSSGRRAMTGNGGDIIIIFNKDGTYKTIFPA